MSLWSRLGGRLEAIARVVRDRRIARSAGAESDAPGDPHTAFSRETGGVPNAEAPDQHSTTGSTPSGEQVGRVAGADPGDAELSGAEVRAEARRKADGQS